MINQWGTWALELANKQNRFILGVMSGTSADAIDLALVDCSGSGYHTKVQLIQSASIPWPEALRERFFALAYREDAPLLEILELDRAITDLFSREIANRIRVWEKDGAVIDLIAFSGQTVFHRGGGLRERGLQCKPPLSLQVGNPAQLARETGLPVIADFRKDHIALGFEGAPLSPLAEVLLYSSNEPRAFLNLGGIANITLLPAVDPVLVEKTGNIDSSGPPLPVPIPFSTDVGPANTVMDQLVRRERPGETFDRNAQFASKGKVIPELLEILMNHSFFGAPKPRSTGPEEFTLNWLDAACKNVSPHQPTGSEPYTLENQLRTLCEVTAISVKETLLQGFTTNSLAKAIPLYVSGGGIHNPVLMEAIRTQLEPVGFKVASSEDIGADNDMKEAILFAVLANERLCGTGWIDVSKKRAASSVSGPFTLGSFYSHNPHLH